MHTCVPVQAAAWRTSHGMACSRRHAVALCVVPSSTLPYCRPSAHPSWPRLHPGRGFKALKQIIKLQSRLGHSEEMVAAYRQLLQYAPVVTRNAAEKKINSVLDFVSSQATDSQLLQARGGGAVRVALGWGMGYGGAGVGMGCSEAARAHSAWVGG